MFCRVICSLIVLSCLTGCRGDNSSNTQTHQNGDSSPESIANESPIAGLQPDESGSEANEQPVSALSPANPFRNGEQFPLRIKDKEFQSDGPGGPLLISFDDLDLQKILDMNSVPVNAPDYFPEWLKNLDGKKIRIRGYMWPTFDETNLDRFPMLRDPGLTDFGRNRQVYEVIAAELNPEKRCDYIHLKPFDVIGTLKIEMIAEDDKPLGLYWITDAEVVRLEKPVK